MTALTQALQRHIPQNTFALGPRTKRAALGVWGPLLPVLVVAYGWYGLAGA